MFDILQIPFIQNALLAGSLVAIVAAIAGYFLVMRGMTFAAHALPNIGFAGAAGAVLIGIEPIFGLLAFTIGAGLAIGILGTHIRERDITVGILMTFALGISLVFISLYAGYAEQAYSVLFGTILGISYTDVQITILFSSITIVLLVILFRPLLFSSLDPIVAEARGVPVRFLALSFLLLVAITISMAVQIIGALLVFTLLIGPPATASRLIRRPVGAIMLAAALGVSYTCLGIFCAANGIGISGSETWPVSFYIATFSFIVYLPVRLLSPLWIGRTGRKQSVLFAERVVPIGTSHEAIMSLQATSTVDKNFQQGVIDE